MKNKWFLALFFLLSACRNRNPDFLEDLTELKKEFVAEVLEGSIEECPFDLSYHLRTVFYSNQLISIFGEFHQYTHLPHGWSRYEGRTFYKMNGKFKSLTLKGLFFTAKSQESVCKYCENVLKNDPCSYFSGKDVLRTSLAFKDISTFVLDNQALIIVFQPYTVAGMTDGPPVVRIPWADLREILESSHPLWSMLNETLSSKHFISSWEKIEWDTF